MKRIINIVLSAALVLSVWSCKEDSTLTSTLDDTTSGAALRSLQETNNLDLSDLASTYEHILEIQDVESGDLVQEVRVYVGFTDDDATSDDPANTTAATLFTTLARSEFAVPASSAFNTHELPEGTFTTTLGDLVTFLGFDATDYDRGDVVNINFEILTTDGRLFNSANVGPNTGATGAFAFFNSPFDYRAAIDDENRVILESLSTDAATGVIRAGAADSVFLDFDLELITNPTVVATGADGMDIADDVIGAVTQIEGGSYFFLYTAGAAAADTVSFAVTGAEAVSDFEMVAFSSSDAYIVDNVAPVASSTGSSLTLSGANVGSISVDFAFNELVFDTVTYVITSPQFDTITIAQDEGEEAEVSSITFTPMIGTARITDTNITFTVTVSGEAGTNGTDAGGNALNSAIPITL